MTETQSLLDEDLRSVMGPGRCVDMTPKKPAAKKPQPPREEQNHRRQEAESTPEPEWEQLEQGPDVIDRMERIWSILKPTALFGGLIALVAFWQKTELMAPAAAIPTMMVCALLAGFFIGKRSAE